MKKRKWFFRVFDRSKRRRGFIKFWAKDDLKLYGDEIYECYVKDSRKFEYDSIEEMQEALDNLKMLSALYEIDLIWAYTSRSYIREISVGEYVLKLIEDIDWHGRKYLNVLGSIRLYEPIFRSNFENKRTYFRTSFGFRIIRCSNPIQKLMEVM